MLGSDQTVEDWEEGRGGEKRQDINTSGFQLAFLMCVTKVALFILMSILKLFADLVKSDMLGLENGPNMKLHSEYFQYLERYTVLCWPS